MHTYSTLSKWLPYRFTTIERKYRREECGDRKGREEGETGERSERRERRDMREEREERDERREREETGARG